MPKKKSGKPHSRQAAGPPPEVGHGDWGCDEDEELEALGVPLDSVVKVWCVHSTPNFSLPWQRRRQERSSGSGFCIDRDNKLILTNAHCVEWSAQVKLQRRGDDTKYLAKVLSVGPECDLAVLTVLSPEFWKGMRAVQLSPKVPHLEEHVLCVGFPVGGDTISVTSGVISRIEVTTYTQASAELLGIQIDAAINSGNSGGPAFNGNGECIGVAFQSMGADEAENIGYVIPTAVVMHFLNDLRKHKKYTGFPTLGIEIQTMENSHLRQAFGMDTKQKGVLISRVAPTAAAAKVLQVRDVMLAFDGEQIGNDGTVRFRKHERVMYTWLVAQKFYGERATLTVLRDGQVQEVVIEDFHRESPLVPIHIFDAPHKAPSYFIIAGLVFTVLTEPYLHSEYGDDWDRKAPLELVKRSTQEFAKTAGQQLVVLAQVLAHEVTMGYEDFDNSLLLTVNGTQIQNLAQLKGLVQDTEGTYLRFGLHRNRTIVLRTAVAKEATPRVLEKHGIPAAVSPDLDLL